MGFFSKIGKAFKSVFSGIMKVFEPILKPLGKLMESTLGKAIMIGLSIFTLGTAMVAGFQGFAGATGGFLDKFVVGAKEFMTSLTGVGAKEAPGVMGPTKEAAANLAGESSQMALATGGPEALVGGAGAGGGNAALEGAKNLTQGNLAAAGDVVSGANVPKSILDAGAAGAAGPTKELAAAGGKLATRTPPKEGGGWLSKAADMGKDFAGGLADFAKTDSGGQIIGSLIQGAGNYYTEKDRQEFDDRIRRQWGQGANDAGIRSIRDASARVGQLETPSAQGIAGAARDTANADRQRPTFNRAYGAAPTGG
jgi:hypothetical protein